MNEEISERVEKVRKFIADVRQLQADIETISKELENIKRQFSQQKAMAEIDLELAKALKIPYEGANIKALIEQIKTREDALKQKVTTLTGKLNEVLSLLIEMPISGDIVAVHRLKNGRFLMPIKEKYQLTEDELLVIGQMLGIGAYPIRLGATIWEAESLTTKASNLTDAKKNYAAFANEWRRILSLRLEQLKRAEEICERILGSERLTPVFREICSSSSPLSPKEVAERTELELEKVQDACYDLIRERTWGFPPLTRLKERKYSPSAMGKLIWAVYKPRFLVGKQTRKTTEKAKEQVVAQEKKIARLEEFIK